MRKAAVFAFDDTCRMILERHAPVSTDRTAAWLACNPSVAGHEIDDPTCGRFVYHSLKNACARMLAGNVWAYRATDPADLFEALRDGKYTGAMHSANLDALTQIAGQAQLHIVAFGAVPGRKYPEAVKAALDAFSLGGNVPLYCLGTTVDNMPLHPLARGKFAVRNDTDLRLWENTI